MRFVNRFYLLATLLPVLLLALVPDLRVPAQRLFIKRWYSELWFFPNIGNRYSPEELIAQAPNSLNKQICEAYIKNSSPNLEQLEMGKRGYPKVSAKFLAFARLSKEHPDNLFILVQSLLEGAGDGDQVAKPWEEQPSRVFTSEAPRQNFESYTPSDIALALQLARRGQKLEPQNTFFDWAAARCLFAMHRDQQAVQVLVAASRKKEFDMRSRDFLRLVMWAYERGSELLPEEKALLSNIQPPPPCLWLSHVAFMALHNAMQKEDAKDIKGAVEIKGALARLLALRIELGLISGDQYRAARDLAIVWNAPNDVRQVRSLKLKKISFKFKSGKATVARRSQRFIRYCNAHGRNDLARENAIFATQVTRFWERANTFKNRDDFMGYMNGNSMSWVFLWWFATACAIWQLLAALGGWPFLRFLSPHSAPKDTAIPVLSPRLVFYPLVAGIVVSIVVIAQGALFLAQGWFGERTSHSNLNYYGAENAAVCGVIALVPPFLFSAATILWATTRLKGAYAMVPTQPRPEWESLGFNREWYVTFVWLWENQEYLWFRILSLVPLFCCFYLLADGMVGGFQPFGIPINRDVVLGVLAVSLFLWFIVTLVWWRFILPVTQEGVVFSGFQALRRAQAWMIPFSLWLIVISLCCAIPPRHKVDQQWQQFLRSENKRSAP